MDRSRIITDRIMGEVNCLLALAQKPFNHRITQVEINKVKAHLNEMKAENPKREESLERLVANCERTLVSNAVAAILMAGVILMQGRTGVFSAIAEVALILNVICVSFSAIFFVRALKMRKVLRMEFGAAQRLLKTMEFLRENGIVMSEIGLNVSDVYDICYSYTHHVISYYKLFEEFENLLVYDKITTAMAK